MPPRGIKPKKKSNQQTILIALTVAIFGVLLVFLLAPAPGDSKPTESSAVINQVKELVKRGRSLFEMDKLQESVEAYTKAVQLKPDSAAANLGLGVSLETFAGRHQLSPENRTIVFSQAIHCYEAVLQHGSATEIPIAHNNIGNILREKFNNFTGAFHHFNESIELSKTVKMNQPFFYPYKNMGLLMEKNGYIEEAIKNFEQAIEIKKDDGLKIYSKLLLPYVYKSEQEMKEWRARYAKNLDDLLEEDLSVDNPISIDGVPNYYLSYHGLSNVELATKYAKLMTKSCPKLTFVAPHVRTYKKAGKRIKVGFVSYYFRDHSVAKMIAGLLKHIPKSRLQITVFNASPRDDDVSRFLGNLVHKYVKLPVGDLGQMRNEISKEQLDVVVYADIGMDPHSYALAHARLAPVQLAMHGHADTTGIPTIDYYVTYAGFDERSFSHYSERVLRVEGHTMLPLWYDLVPFKADMQKRDALRAKYNIPEDAFVFGCLQTLFKITPNMDKVIKQIFQRAPNSVLLVKELPMTDKVGQFLLDRWKSSLGEDINRVIMLPPLNDDEYKNIFATVDAVLDSFPFGGHTSSMDAFSNGLPVVTKPTELLSGRCTLGFLRMLHSENLIAHNDDEYVEIAARLAVDDKFLVSAKRNITQNLPALIKDQTSVKSWEKMLVAVATGTNMHNFLV